MAGGRSQNEHAAARSSDARLAALGREFDRRRRVAHRSWRAWQLNAGHDEVGRRPEAWSAAIDASLAVAEAISRTPADDLEGLLVKYEALWWWMNEDNSVLDASLKRWFSRFRRDLRRLAGRPLTPKQ